ncbi:flagellar biosynthesis protein FlgK [Malaciobacter halophilus]|uniref:Flagellar hook-associated protein 1 n=1 Tax=Malaciobacter halophilus TaxID=197482 RepID=A0A2N1J5D1_9BACT|nr:flagellar basal body rod C-terminal domain-containing protein [Malaciobacter halophilus]AXH10753.1 proximal flagellar hook-filament junction protein [Malaciobacter halophilus]PKI81775.1 flagellar biosynthesis protein FlgK [Malaciobacter halophilus]
MLNSLNVAQSGLAASKVAVENVSNNIANENTPGYKKRVIDQSELEHSDSRFYGRGVEASTAYRITSIYMSQNLIRENTRENYFIQKSQMLGNIETAFKETDESGLSKDINRYLQAVENLRASPTSEIYKSDLITHGTLLVENMQTLYSDIEKAEELTKESMKENISQVNGILKEIGKINQQLGKSQIASNDLLDRRDQLELELSKYADISSEEFAGTYTLKIGDVVAIGNNTVIRDITVEDQYSPQKDRFIKDDGKTSSILDGVTFDNDDTITYKLNNSSEVSVQFGESIDTNGDGTPDFTVDETNYVRGLVHKINSDPELSKTVVAYNGTYTQQADGSKTTDDRQDNFLLVEAVEPGEVGKFEGRITVTEQTDASDPTSVTSKNTVFRDEYQSNDGENSVQIYAFDAPIELKSGVLKAQSENLTTSSASNKFTVYKDKLDALAQTLSDITDKFVKTGETTYIEGGISTDRYTGNQDDIVGINLFSGSTVKSLQFNTKEVNNLDQTKLDYLATLQWKSDISFEGRGQDLAGPEATSISEYFQEVRISVSSDKETSDFLLTTQKAVKQSVQSSYDNLVKVDKDEEMLNLIKFQSAYTANAKIVTVVDEMLQTILGLK